MEVILFEILRGMRLEQGRGGTSNTLVDDPPRRKSCFLTSCTTLGTSFFQAFRRALSGRLAIGTNYILEV